MGAATFPETLGRFGVGASSELILFMFLMSMIGGIGLIEARRLGVIRRDPVDTDPGPLDPPRAGHQPARHLSMRQQQAIDGCRREDLPSHRCGPFGSHPLGNGGLRRQCKPSHAERMRFSASLRPLR
jgi:hypothetical protein